MRASTTYIYKLASALSAIFVLCLTASAVSAADGPARPFIRETTGSYKIQGWERELVRGNPNLGHWTWSAMVGYTQSKPSMKTGKQAGSAPMPRREWSYRKPVHVPLPVAQAQPRPLEMKAQAPQALAYKPSRSDENVSGALTYTRSSNEVSGKVNLPKALSYEGPRGSLADATGVLERKDVYGKLTSGAQLGGARAVAGKL